MERKNYYAVVDQSAYKIEIVRQGRLLHRVRLESSYPGGTSEMEVVPEEAGPLLDQFKRHKVSHEEYLTQLKKNQGQQPMVQHRDKREVS